MALACLNRGAMYAPRHALILEDNAHLMRRLTHRTVLPNLRWHTRTENLLRLLKISCWYLWGLNGMTIFAKPADLDLTVNIHVEILREHGYAEFHVGTQVNLGEFSPVFHSTASAVGFQPILSDLRELVLAALGTAPRIAANSLVPTTALLYVGICHSANSLCLVR